MSLKDSVNTALMDFSREWLPGLESTLASKSGQLRRRLDQLNRSLAELALPEDRRQTVGRLSIERKAARAGHRSGKKI